MKKYVFIALFIVSLVLIFGLAVSKTPKSNNHAAENYFTQLDKTPKTLTVKNVASKFKKLFGDFKAGATEEIIRQTYAKEFYFNDTFVVLTNIEDLVPHMINTAQNTKSTTVEILDSAFSGTDYYIRWVMVMEFKAKGKNVYSRSIGMTQLRFDAEGKIIFHQDFWDSAEGFYQHLPYIGYFIRKIRSKL